MANNEKILRQQDEAMSKGDLDAFWSVFAPDCIAHVGGRSKIAGDYKGLGELQATFGTFMQALGENPIIETHDIIANDTHGIVLQSFSGERNGERKTFPGMAVFHMSGGKITEAWFTDVDPYESDSWVDAGLK
jgi:hypothetical protein